MKVGVITVWLNVNSKGKIDPAKWNKTDVKNNNEE